MTKDYEPIPHPPWRARWPEQSGEEMPPPILLPPEIPPAFYLPLLPPSAARPSRAAYALVALGMALAIAVIFLTLAHAAAAAPRHHRHHHGHHYRQARPALDSNGNLARSLVATINAKLRRWVRRSGACAGHEALVTYYWQGQRVASGGRFNPHGLTAAHRSLPFGTMRTFRNPKNNRSVTVVINDRGPATIAEYDLSLGAARALGLTQSAYLCVLGGAP